MTLIIKGDFSNLCRRSEPSQDTVIRIIESGKNVTPRSSKNLHSHNKSRSNVLIINRGIKTKSQKITRDTPDKNNKKMPFSWCKLVQSYSFWIEIIIRAGFFALNQLYLWDLHPFERQITTAELGLYAFPRTDSYVTTDNLWVMVFGIPPIVMLITYVLRRSNADLWYSFLTISLTYGLSANTTDAIKAIVGRPRPDFLSRCFGDINLKEFFVEFPANGVLLTSLNCTGDPDTIIEGRRSFPSGHSSYAFALFGFVAFYLAGKLHTFDSSSQRQGWKLCLFWLPLVCSTAIAASRTSDYHHHWQDVSVGSLIGLSIAYVCYRFYYPPLNSHLCHKPYSNSNDQETTKKRPSSCSVV